MERNIVRRDHNLEKQGYRLVLFFAVLTAVVVFLMLDVSAPLWEALPLVRLAQFPWRLLTLTVLSTGFLCGAAALDVGPTPDAPSPLSERVRSNGFSRSVYGRRPKATKVATTNSLPQPPIPRPGSGSRARATALLDIPTLVLVILLVLGSLPYMRAGMSQQEVSLAGLMRFQQSADEMTGSTAWVREIPSWSPLADYHIAGEPLTSKVDFDSLYRQPGRAHARTLELEASRELVEYWAERPVLLTFNTFYYPGWHAYLLDPETGKVLQELPIALRGELGLMTVRLPAGVGQVLLRLEATPVRALGTAMTLVSLAVVAAGLGLAAWARRTRRRQEVE
jgi:hypothetical protein